MVLPDGRSPQLARARGLNIGKSKRVRKLLVAVLPIAILRVRLLVLTFRRYLEAASSTSRLFVQAVTIALTASGSTPNWLEYRAADKTRSSSVWYATPKCTVAESEDHRIVANLTEIAYGKS